MNKIIQIMEFNKDILCLTSDGKIYVRWGDIDGSNWWKEMKIQESKE